MIRRKVLVACTDESLAFDVHRCLYSFNSSVDVLLAASEQIAQEIVDETSIDLLITDRLDRLTENADIVPWIVRNAPATHVLLLCDQREKDALMIRLCSGSVYWLCRESQAPTIAAKAAEILRTETHSLYGSLSTLSMADLIQITCLNRRALAIRARCGEDEGTIFVRGGDVHHAVFDGGLYGEKAFHRILEITHGEFTTLAMLDDLPRTIRRGWQELLLESVRLQDERAHAMELEAPSESSENEAGAATVDAKGRLATVPHRRRAQPPRLAEPPANAPLAKNGRSEQSSASDVEVARLIDDGFARLRAGDNEGAKRAWESARQRDPENRALNLNLRKLSKIDRPL
jgi:hypothetical protein